MVWRFPVTFLCPLRLFELKLVGFLLFIRKAVYFTPILVHIVAEIPDATFIKIMQSPSASQARTWYDEQMKRLATKVNINRFGVIVEVLTDLLDRPGDFGLAQDATSGKVSRIIVSISNT